MININKDYRKNYDIIETIGSGKFSTVYKAKVKGKEEYVAIKVIKKEKIKEEFKKLYIMKDDVFNNIEERFINVVNNMKICGNNNKNSVQFYKYFCNEEEFAIVMELCDENLLTFFKRKRVNLSKNEIIF